MEVSVRRFSCTQCGKCCNRSPEVELSEATALADLFVFRLMFRVHSLPRELRDYAARDRSPNASAIFYQKKRLFAAQAARRHTVKVRGGGGKPVEHTNYLMVSALALDTTPGACGALTGSRCSIYERRPFACRTVPFHYSRVDASSARDLDAFLATPGHACDSGEAADVVIEGGRLVDAIRETRAAALSLAESDRPWREAIGRRTRAPSPGLPSLDEIEASASFGALTTSMRVAWQIAVEEGLMGAEQARAAVAEQLTAIERELARSGSSSDARETLREMQAEYRAALAPPIAELRAFTA